MHHNKDILINGRKVASGVKIEGIVVHTGLKAQPVLDEEDLLNLIDDTNLLLKQCAQTVSPEGELYKKVDNLYIEVVDGKPKLRVVYEE